MRADPDRVLERDEERVPSTDPSTSIPALFEVSRVSGT
jgi:hypothetical protein